MELREINPRSEIATLSEIEEAPKVDLHMHLDGSVSREILEQVAKKHGVHLPPEILKYYPNPGPFDANNRWDEFKRFLDCFGLPLSIMRTPESLYDTTLEVIRDLGKQNVIYAELRLAPSYIASKEHSMQVLIEAALRAMEDGYRETGVLTKLVIAVPREIDSKYSGDSSGNGITAENIVDAAMGFVDSGVVGIDLVCAEQFGPEPYVDLFRSTVGSKLKRTVHAGEAGPQRAKNVEIAVREMGADGIGHGLTLGTDSAQDGLVDEIQRAGIRVERCPLSNVAMSTTDGNLDGLPKLMDKGLLVSIGSDDYGVFGPTTRLAENLLYVAKKLGFGVDGIRQLTENAARSAFVSVDEQQELLKRIAGFYK